MSEPETFTVAAIRRRRQRKPPPRIDGPADIHRVLSPLLHGADREHFYVVLLSTKNHVLAVELVSVGSLSASIVHPREVFKPAIVASAAAIVVAHNHPLCEAWHSGAVMRSTRLCGGVRGMPRQH